MKKGFIVLAVVVGVLVVGAFSLVGFRNSLVTADEAVTASWAQVENVLQRRSDLIPNLVKTVQGYAKQEKEIFTQVAEARAIGADCILLIMAALDDATALALHTTARRYGLDVLIEVHDADEMARALRLPDGMIGINNRNLKTLKTDLNTTHALAPLAPPGRLLVSESGLRSHADLRGMMSHGVSTFLIGEYLLKQDNLVTATRAMLNLPNQAP